MLEPSREPEHKPASASFPVVGVGCSAGGLEALRRFFVKMPADCGMAFVVIQHLDPTRESLMTDLLARSTEIPVVEVSEEKGGLPVEPNRIYFIRPNREMTIRDARLHLAEFSEKRGRRRPVDAFFRSLAEDQREKAIAVVLSGTGTNGSEGLKAVKSDDGMVMVQAPEDAEYDGMPRAAIQTGLVDFVLPADKMAEALQSYTRHPYVREGALRAQEEAARVHVGEILALINARAGHDFRCYKKATLMRRLARRMGLLNIERLADYAAHLREHPDELQHLARDLLISVTNFFRDPEVWEALEREVFEPLVRTREPEAPIRVWVPACSTGEEAFTVAMLLAEHVEAARKRCPIKVFATDPLEAGLSYARAGVYPESIELDVVPERLQRFFEKQHGRYLVKEHIRESVVFAPQNLLSDPPFSRLDLITCRNLLIYLEPDVQQKLIALFHFALSEDGYLVLGNAETIGRQDDLFTPVSKKLRIYRKIGPTRHDRVDFPLSEHLEPRREVEPLARSARQRSVPNQAVQQALLDAYAPPSVVVDQSFQVVHIYGEANRYLTHPAGPPTRDLRQLVLDGLRPALRSAAKRAQQEKRRVTAGGSRGDGGRRVSIAVAPLDDRGAAGLLLVSFEEKTRAATERVSAAPAADADVERRMEDELRSRREELESTIEELETSNEELRASNEEVTSINEELQSTNEELETAKEELQSLNEELSTVNHQLEAKLQELEETKNDLSNLLSSTEIAVLFLDRQFRIRRFTPPMTRLVRLMPGDVGRPIGDITLRFTDETLLSDAESVLVTLAPVEKEISTEDGRWCLRRVLPYRTEDDRIAGVVITLVDITRRKRAEDELRELNEDLEVRVTQRTRALQLLHDVTLIANESETVEQALRRSLERVCRYLNWPIGHAWLPSDGDPRTFVSGGIWYLNAPEKYAEFAEVTAGAQHSGDHGLIGEVLRSKRPTWFSELTEHAGLIRADLFRKSDLHSAAAFPVLVRDRVVAVLEFFDGKLSEPIQILLDGMRQFGVELGRVFERQELQHEVARISEEEQRRFSHELHDSIAQELTGIGMMAETMRQDVVENVPLRAELMQNLVGQIQETQRQVRNLARGLAPVELDAAGLSVALEALVERICETGVNCRLEARRPVHVASGTAATHLYRIAQEALHNALKHSGATEIVLKLDESEISARGESTVTLRIRDNGRGLDPQDGGHGMGQRIMRYRANLIGAHLQIDSHPRKGTTVTCRLPQTHREAPAPEPAGE